MLKTHKTRKPTLDELCRALRARICTQCHNRPAGSENIASDTPRECESECSLFRAAPRIHQLTYLDPMLANLHEAAGRVLHETCPAGRCASSSQCPQRRYRTKILQTIEHLMHQR